MARAVKLSESKSPPPPEPDPELLLAGATADKLTLTMLLLVSGSISCPLTDAARLPVACESATERVIGVVVLLPEFIGPTEH